MSDLLNRVRDIGIIPVIKLNSVEQAVPLAKALIDGGIPAAEVTFRTEAAADGIKAIKEAYPEMLLGAGTVINKDYAKKAIDAGAEFIVSPGFNPEVVDFVLDKGVPMIPGVANPGQIEQALCKGLDCLKLFPAETLGGVAMLDALSGPFPNVKFMATGGINAKNMGEYLKRKNILAIGGSWMVKDDCELVTKLSKEAVANMHGFTLAHLGLNGADNGEAAKIAKQFEIFGFLGKEGNSSWFNNSLVDSTSFETMKGTGKGIHGHIGIKTWNIERALAYLKQFGINPDMSTAKYLGEEGKSPLKFVYTDMSIGGFAVHLNKA